MVGDSQGHRRGLFDDRVAAAELVEREPEGHSVSVVVPFSARAVGQPRHAA